MPRKISEKFYIEDAEVIRATPDALLVSAPIFDNEEWIPKSAVDDDSEVWDDTDDASGPGRLVVQLWLAAKRGWT